MLQILINDLLSDRTRAPGSIAYTPEVPASVALLQREEVRKMIFSFRGTGLSPTRLKLITTKDHSGLTAADVAEQNGHKERNRMGYTDRLKADQNLNRASWSKRIPERTGQATL